VDSAFGRTGGGNARVVRYPRNLGAGRENQ